MRSPAIAFILLSISGFYGCSSSQQQQQLQEELDNEELDNGQFDNQNNEFASQNGDFKNEPGEAINNASTNEFADENFLETNQLLSNSQAAPGQGQFLENNLAEFVGEDASSFPNTTSGVSNSNIPVNEGTFAASQPAFQTSAPTAPAGTGGRVKYAVQDTSALNQPGGNPVASLETGDHPLVIAEGEYDQLSDGSFVSSRDLTTQAVPRVRRNINWQ